MRLFNKKDKEREIEKAMEEPFVIPDQETGKVKTPEEIAPETKPKRQVFRICRNCQKHFYAQRRDAKYCSASCKQKAYLKGEKSWNY